jgi:hypothetical protein
MLYIVNRKYYCYDRNEALTKAMNILRERATEPINDKYKISTGKKGGLCVTLLDDWKKVGNANLLKVVIQVVSIT